MNKKEKEILFKELRHTIIYNQALNKSIGESSELSADTDNQLKEYNRGRKEELIKIMKKLGLEVDDFIAKIKKLSEEELNKLKRSDYYV